jgi:hypothetical protein
MTDSEPLKNEPRLCPTCTKINVRALLLAADPHASTKNFDHWRHYKHLPSLLSLKTSAPTCDLCGAIWEAYRTQVEPFQLVDEELQKGLGQTCIWIGTTPCRSDLHGLPHIAVSQHSEFGQMRILSYFEVYAVRGREPLDHKGMLAFSTFSHSGSTECLALCRKWLEECRNHHVECKDLENIHGCLPTRVIAVEAKNEDGEPRPRLVDGGQRIEEFAALSYCWGGESLLMLNSDTEGDLRAGLPLEKFPATMRDAIVATQQLGIKYLWIDALCIRQDSAKDWDLEATKMRDIYKGAVITIAAASSSKSSDGFFNQRKTTNIHCRLSWNNGEDPQPNVFLRPGSEIWDDPARTSIMHTRGWTLQETLLAPRTIYFGEQVVTFECANGQADEAGRSLKSTENYRNKSYMQSLGATITPESKSRSCRILHYPSLFQSAEKVSTFSHSIPSRQLRTFLSPSGVVLTHYDLWREIVMQYSTRRLTKSGDALPALAGIAREFHVAMKDTYYAGLWAGDIVHSLCWMSHIGHDAGEGSYEEYSGPSWSWASLHGYGLYISFLTNAQNLKLIAKIVDIKIIHAGPDPFGKIIEGRLKLRTWFLRVPSPQESPAETKVPALFHYVQRNVKVHAYEFRMQHVPYDDQQFALIKFASYKPVHQSKDTGMMLLIESQADDNWKRIGIIDLGIDLLRGPENTDAFYLETSAKEWESSIWKKRTICIV